MSKGMRNMKRRNWICLILIVGCLAVFFGYRSVTQLASDHVAPEIFMEESLELSVNDPQSVLLQGVTARDDRDGDVTDSLLVEKVKLVDKSGKMRVTYAAFDSAGNVAKAAREVQYTDYHSPRFSLSAPLLFTQYSSVDVLSLLTVEDLLDGDISHRARATLLDNTSINTPGTHDVEFRVTNSLGETVELVLPVEVRASGSYEAKLTLTEYLVYLNAGEAFQAKNYLKTFTRGTTETSLTAGLPQNYVLKTEGTVDTGTPGVYSVSYTVTYTKVNETNPSLNQSYSAVSKLIVVVEG